MSAIDDSRFDALTAWLSATLGTRDWTLAPASADASFRRYFRITPASRWKGERSLIVMDAPPPMENCAPFVKVAHLLAEAGVHAPRVMAQDLTRGFLLLTDLGTQTYLEALGSGDADRLLNDATDALVRWQSATRHGVLPPYDETLLRRELALFPDWYVARHLGAELRDDEPADLSRVFDAIVGNNLAQPKVYVHRDYMPRNLMVSEPNPGVLDFQDAVEGPITYDIASLMRDAFLTFDDERVLDITIRYWEKAKRAGLPVNADFGAFWRDVDWMGLQRHLKVLGIFARLRHRDGKNGYVEDAPRFVAYVRPVAMRYPELAPLARLVDRLHGVEHAAGYTF